MHKAAFIICALASCLWGCAAEDEGIYFINVAEVAPANEFESFGLPGKWLRRSGSSGGALYVSVPPDWAQDGPVTFAQTVELVVVSGAVESGDERLKTWDYARVEDGTSIRLASREGAAFLLFFETGLPLALNAMKGNLPKEEPWTIKHAEDLPWVSGTAMAEAGRNDVPLQIKHYKQDAQTGARTYLVKVKPGVKIPWETHRVPEEAFVLEGAYRLAECLPQGKRVGTYTPGGYFYRPPGIAHNGPQSGTSAGTVMLIRTPAALDVTLVDGC